MPALPARPLSRDRAWSCVMLNFSLAGLGTLKAGRKFSGVCQLLLVFAGFFLMCGWIIDWSYRIFLAQASETIPAGSINWLWQCGAAGFLFSYIWTLLTCVSLMRQAKLNEAENRLNIPPRLADSGKPPKLE